MSIWGIWQAIKIVLKKKKTCDVTMISYSEFAECMQRQGWCKRCGKNPYLRHDECIDICFSSYVEDRFRQAQKERD